MKKKLLALGLIACCVALTALLAGCGSSESVSRSSDSFEIEEEEVIPTITTVNGEEVEYNPTGIKNILVIGDDGWEDHVPGHADMMCLLRVDLDTKTITEVTIPRDTRYQFEDGSFDKLNQVYTRNGGGEKGSIEQTKAASQIIGEPIDYYVTIGFDGFEEIVNHFGGVQVNLPYNVDYSFYTHDYPDEVYEAGEQTLDGWRAMAISRTRTGYGTSGVQEPDLIRQYTDRMMLTQLMQSAYANADGIEALFTLLQDNIQTNIPLEAQVLWAQTLASNGTITVKGTTGPFYGDTDEEAGGLWLVLADPDGWAAVMNAVRANATVEEISDAVFTSFANPNFPVEIPAATGSEITIS